jgi:hypothetical protein
LPGEKEPEGLAEGSGEVGDGGVCGENQVQVVDEGGGVGEVLVLRGKAEGAETFRDLVDLVGGGAVLEGDPADTGEFQEREEGLQGGGALVVGTIVGVAGPVQADG